jgi:hypothetical protein
MTSTHVLESNAQVGSSARIIAGFHTIALAMATLCCCHQDNSFGLLFIFSTSPTFSSADIAISFL